MVRRPLWALPKLPALTKRPIAMRSSDFRALQWPSQDFEKTQKAEIGSVPQQLLHSRSIYFPTTPLTARCAKAAWRCAGRTASSRSLAPKQSHFPRLVSNASGPFPERVLLPTDYSLQKTTGHDGNAHMLHSFHEEYPTNAKLATISFMIVLALDNTIAMYWRRSKHIGIAVTIALKNTNPRLRQHVQHPTRPASQHPVSRTNFDCHIRFIRANG